MLWQRFGLAGCRLTRGGRGRAVVIQELQGQGLWRGSASLASSSTPEQTTNYSKTPLLTLADKLTGCFPEPANL